MLIAQGVLMILLPVAIGLAARRRRPLPWKALGIGAGMFLLAQVLKAAVAVPVLVRHLIDPTSWAMVLFGSLLPGVFEEITKWLPLKLMRPRRWDTVLAFGLGFGGIESVYLGLNVLALGIVAATGAQGLPEPVRSQIAATAGPGALGLLVSAVERASAICVHLGLSLVNAAGLRPGRWPYLLLAMALHTGFDVIAAAWQFRWKALGIPILPIEAVVVAGALLALWYVRRTLRREPAPLPEA